MRSTPLLLRASLVVTVLTAAIVALGCDNSSDAAPNGHTAGQRDASPVADKPAQQPKAGPKANPTPDKGKVEMVDERIDPETLTAEVLARGARALATDPARGRIAWLDDEGRIRRLVVDYLPLIEAMVGRGFEEGSTVSAMTHTFNVVAFGEVSVEVPEIGEGSEEG